MTNDASPRRSWVVAFACLVAAAALTTGGLRFYDSHDDTPRYCTTEALIASGGPYVHDPDQSCLLVAPDGKPYTTPDGQVVN